MTKKKPGNTKLVIFHTNKNIASIQQNATLNIIFLSRQTQGFDIDIFTRSIINATSNQNL